MIVTSPSPVAYGTTTTTIQCEAGRLHLEMQTLEVAHRPVASNPGIARRLTIALSPATMTAIEADILAAVNADLGVVGTITTT